MISTKHGPAGATAMHPLLEGADHPRILNGRSDISEALPKVAPRDTDVPPTDGDRIHLAKTKEHAWCGVKIDKWVSMSEWSNRPCRCCNLERLAARE